jgi:hypothetical protein
MLVPHLSLQTLLISSGTIFYFSVHFFFYPAAGCHFDSLSVHHHQEHYIFLTVFLIVVSLTVGVAKGAVLSDVVEVGFRHVYTSIL